MGFLDDRLFPLQMRRWYIYEIFFRRAARVFPICGKILIRVWILLLPFIFWTLNRDSAVNIMSSVLQCVETDDGGNLLFAVFVPFFFLRGDIRGNSSDFLLTRYIFLHGEWGPSMASFLVRQMITLSCGALIMCSFLCGHSLTMGGLVMPLSWMVANLCEKNPGCLGYIRDYTTQLYGDYNKPL